MPSGEALSTLVVKAGATLCALPLAQVTETMRPLPIESLAGAPPFVRGLSIIRGAPAPVIDLAKLLTGESSAATPARFVSIRLGSRPATLSVDAVVGVRAIDPERLETLPSMLRRAEASFVEAIGALDGELLVLLRGSRVLSAADWQAIEASGGRR